MKPTSSSSENGLEAWHMNTDTVILFWLYENNSRVIHTTLKSRFFSTHALASLNSSFISIIYRVSKESTIVAPWMLPEKKKNITDEFQWHIFHKYRQNYVSIHTNNWALCICRMHTEVLLLWCNKCRTSTAAK